MSKFNAIKSNTFNYIVRHIRGIFITLFVLNLCAHSAAFYLFVRSVNDHINHKLVANIAVIIHRLKQNHTVKGANAEIVNINQSKNLYGFIINISNHIPRSAVKIPTPGNVDRHLESRMVTALLHLNSAYYKSTT